MVGTSVLVFFRPASRSWPAGGGAISKCSGADVAAGVAAGVSVAGVVAVVPLVPVAGLVAAGLAGVAAVVPLLATALKPGMMSCWPARTLEGSVMLLAAASSPTGTWYLRAMTPRLSPTAT